MRELSIVEIHLQFLKAHEELAILLNGIREAQDAMTKADSLS